MPPELHAKYPHGDALPLYQMIAKNAGIRRARGQFVLATNIDILFSNELAEYLAARRLERGRMYRIDRHDAMSEVPADAPVEGQLAWCGTHLIRVNRREGSFRVKPDGRPALEARDAAAPDSGIVFGRGWYAVESHIPPEVFRWAGESAELLLEDPPGPGCELALDIEPGPSIGGRPLQLEIEVGGRSAGVPDLRRAAASAAAIRLSVPEAAATSNEGCRRASVRRPAAPEFSGVSRGVGEGDARRAARVPDRCRLRCSQSRGS